MRLLLDTSAYSLAMRGNESAVALIQHTETLVVCPIVVGELLSGFARGKRLEKNRKVLDEFISLPSVILSSIDHETGEFYGSILNELRKAGTPIPTNDIWIAACAMQSGAKIATADRHFLRIHGLLCEFIDS